MTTVSTNEKIYPHLWYAREAEAAATLYVSVFPGSRVDRVTTMHSDSPSDAMLTMVKLDIAALEKAYRG